jgi:hypothetical protein
MSKAKLLDQQIPYALTSSPANNWTGIRLYWPTLTDDSQLMNDPFPKAFEKAGIPISGVGSGSVSGVVANPQLNRPIRTIYIGQKPLPD